MGIRLRDGISGYYYMVDCDMCGDYAEPIFDSEKEAIRTLPDWLIIPEMGEAYCPQCKERVEE